jgi:hypothetical protein
MRTWMMGVIGISLLGFGSVSSQPGKLASRNGWHADLAGAKALARKTAKPLMVVFRCEP